MVSLIVAVDSNFGISRNGGIPWNYKEDYNFFVDSTSRNYGPGKNVLIMGKNTWLSLPKQLPNRITIVVSNTLQLEVNDTLYVVRSLDEARELTKNIICGHVFICGGKALYEASLPYVDNIFLTMIHHDYACDNVISLSLNKYKTHKKHTFELTDKNTEEKHMVSFHKLYLDNLPNFWIIQKEEQQLLDLLEKILRKGSYQQTRNSETWAVFGETLKFNMAKGFPLLTTRRISFKIIFEELMQFLRGDTNANHLSEKGIKIWDLNTSREFLDSVGLNHFEPGCLGTLYPHAFRHYGAEYKGMHHDYDSPKQGFDQIEYCINLLKTDPFSRRILITSYNPSQMFEAPLFPCHSLIIQFNVKIIENQYQLSCNMYMRSSDVWMAANINTINIVLLVLFLCEVINNDNDYKGLKYIPGKVMLSLGNVHIYSNNREQSIRQILRDPHPTPTISINRKVTDINDFLYEDFTINNYVSYSNIASKMIS